MSSLANLDAETVTLLRARRSLIAHLPRKIPERNEIIRESLQAASEIFVWPQRKGTKPGPYPTEFLAPERGRFRLDVAKAEFTGFGPFWHLGDRGSIALRVPRRHEFVGSILKRCPLLPGCTEPGIFASRSMLAKGDSPGAIRYCEQVIDGGEFALLLPPSSQYLSIFAPNDDLAQLYRLAKTLCRPWNVNNDHFSISECHRA